MTDLSDRQRPPQRADVPARDARRDHATRTGGATRADAEDAEIDPRTLQLMRLAQGRGLGDAVRSAARAALMARIDPPAPAATADEPADGAAAAAAPILAASPAAAHRIPPKPPAKAAPMAQSAPAPQAIPPEPAPTAQPASAPRAVPTKPAKAGAASAAPPKSQPSPSSPAAAAEKPQRPRAAAASAAAEPLPRLTAPQLAIRLRKLVEADEPWERIEPTALDLVGVSGDPQVAAQMVELAFLHAGVEALVRLLERFAKERPGFWRVVHPSVRAHVVVRLARARRLAAVQPLLVAERDGAYLTPQERLAAFLALESHAATAQDPTVPYLYFDAHAEALLGAASALEQDLGVGAAHVLLVAGRLALRLGFDREAREILGRIDDATPEREQALILLLQERRGEPAFTPSRYDEMLSREPTSEGRLKLIAGFLQVTRDAGGIKDANRPTLNALLRDPLKLVATTPAAWAALSRLLVEHRELTPLLPSLLDVFHTHACRFFEAELDDALWRGFLDLAPITPRDRYLRGLALMHHYVERGPAGEGALWEARDLVVAAKKEWSATLPCDWRTLQRATFEWIARCQFLTEDQRQKMQAQLRVAQDDAEVAVVDVEEYARRSARPPLDVLRRLEAFARRRADAGLRAMLLRRRAELSHLVNDDLTALWQLAAALREPDLAWRAATVAAARGALLPAARPAWEISGEKRSHYPFTRPGRAVVNALLAAMPPEGARFVQALLGVGHRLGELIAIVQPTETPAPRAPRAADDTLEARADAALAALQVLPGARPRFRFFGAKVARATWLPPFMQVLPPTVWGHLVARILERLGAESFGMQASRLDALVRDVNPRVASSRDLRRRSGKVAGWLKSLGAAERLGWQELSLCRRELGDDAAMDALAGFACRLATVIHPHHFVALTSLIQARAPVAVLRDLECFVVSDAYSAMRKAFGTASKVPIPASLEGLSRLTT
jgi:hypothetical protein